ncbi:hypothetical protein BDZ97DRAFT_1835238 [Flammula alnicola]|nr:hypothetical protein BDZ97DRAFT_1835238 [Flammula alnicola]
MASITPVFPYQHPHSFVSLEAEHEFELSTPRARRASAPARVFFHAELLASEPQYTHPHDRQQSVASSTTSVTPNPITNSPKKRRSPCFPEDALYAAKFVAPSITEDQIAISEVETMSDRAVDAHDDDRYVLNHCQIKSESGRASTADPEASVSTSDNGVATATLLSLFRSSSEEGRRSEADSRLSTTDKNNSSKPALPDPFLNSSPPLPSEGQLSLPPLSSVERSRSEPMTATRSSRMLKTSRRLLILDFHDTKTHPSVDEPSAAEPIAISLTVRSSTSKAALRSSQQHPCLSQAVLCGETPTPYHARTLSQPIDTPTTPPLTPTLLPTPPNMAPTGLSSSPTSSTSSSSRRQTYTPPSPGSMMSTPMSMTASRHLSLSAMFSSPAYGPSSPSGGLDLGDLDEGNADLPLLPPTPGPSAARFSFSLPRRKSGSNFIGCRMGIAKTKGHRGSGVGFSISGETELRMALAAGAASAGIVESGFRFQETAVTSTTHNNGLSDNVGDVDARSGKGAMDTASQGNFMARVRKLRKGLKEMLLMTSTTTA